MYVAKVKLDNIRGFHDARSVNLDLARPEHDSYAGWTVMVGPNGSGKSTLLRAIALALAGPAAAPTLVTRPTSWISAGKDQGGIELDLKADPLDSFPKGFQPPKDTDIYADIVFHPETVLGESNIDRNGPWQDNATGWFSVAYSPFRRLGGEVATPLARPQARLAGLFREDMSLSDGVNWLLRRSDLRAAVLSVLGDKLFDGYRILLDPDDLWLERDDGVRFSVREMGDAYRSIAALVIDLLRNVNAAYGGIPLESDQPVVPVPGVVLIDEIEAHLDPTWQQRIGEWLKQHFPRVQFLVTTNSPYVCQAADPAGLIHLPPLHEQKAPYVVDNDLFQRIVFGSGEDIVLSELFGLDSPYSPLARRMRRELVDLELKVVDGQANEIQLARYHELQELLVSSPHTRSRELEALLQRERARRGSQ